MLGVAKKSRLEGVRIVTMDEERRIFTGSVDIVGGKIEAVGPDLPPPDEDTVVINRPGWVCLPGLIQAHVHLCQTLFRGTAEGLTLDRWLKERIWPFEAMHDEESIAAAARLGIAEAILGGATTLLDMGTVHHTGVIAEVVNEMGIRATLGKALMDLGEGVPSGLLQPSGEALDEACALYERWHGRADGRIRFAFAPRFTLSVSSGLWQEIANLAAKDRILVHTHASETEWENDTCLSLHGSRPIPTLEKWGVFEAPAILAHGIWIDEIDREILARQRVGIAHCPGSNAKLGSGIIDLRALLNRGIPVGLGSDGAACNDIIDSAAEMRLAAQLQSITHGPGYLPGDSPLLMSTRLGASAIDRGDEIGSIERGRAADLILFREDDLDWTGDLPVHHSLSYGSSGARPREVYINGKLIVAEGTLINHNMANIKKEAAKQRRRLLERVK